MPHYCYQCGTELVLQFIDHREREVCPKCSWVHYAQLKVGAAVIIENDDNELLLLQRVHEPWRGSWMIPAGYVEVDEDPKDAARREVFEETGLRVELDDLLTAYYFDDDPRGNGVAFVYKATKITGELHINDEASDAQFYAADEIPAYLTKGGHDRIIGKWQIQAIKRKQNLDV